MYFSKFPKLNYDIKGDGNLSQFTHILKRVKLDSTLIQQIQKYLIIIKL